MGTTANAAVRGRQHQLAWAAAHGSAVDNQGYVFRLEDNLFQPLHERTRAELLAGAGDELGLDGSRGKMQALHSSSALAVNVFDYWRARERQPLEEALGRSTAISDIEFERTFSMEMQGTPPHLDVVLSTEGGGVIAIESKFLETYPGRSGHRPFRSSYFPPGPGRWAFRTLRGCQTLAEELRSGGRIFQHLDAQQLLKHALGLAHTVRERHALWYLWYDPEGAEGERHRQEIEEFANCVDEGLGFRAMSYQELIAALRGTCGGAHADYLRYVEGRYGSGRGGPGGSS